MVQLMNRRKFIKLAATGSAGMLGFGGGGLLYSMQVEPAWLEVTQHELTLPHLDPVFDGFRLVHFSDIHMDFSFMSEARLNQIIDVVNQQRADFVAITGDYVTSLPLRDLPEQLQRCLSRLQPSTGTIFGNHDYWTDVAAVRQALQAAGMIDLNNQVHTIQRNGISLHIAGVDDVWEMHDDLPRVLKTLPTDGAAILLAHEPDFAEVSSQAQRFDLQLSGHSHGGQVCLPWRGPLVVPHLAQRYPSGLYQVGNMVQYTTRGVGMVRPQVRLFCRPEIAVFVLRSPQV